MTKHLEDILAIAATNHCVLKPTSCSDGCNVAWLQEHNGSLQMLGSVRHTIKLSATVMLPGVIDATEENILQAAAHHAWQPKWRNTDNGQVSWVLNTDGGDHPINSIRQADPTNPAHIENAKKLTLNNNQQLEDTIKEKPVFDPFHL
jgi:hypothetical protein